MKSGGVMKSEGAVSCSDRDRIVCHRLRDSLSVLLSVVLGGSLGLLVGCQVETGAGSETESKTPDKKEAASSSETSSETAKAALVEVSPPTRGVIRDTITLSGDLQAQNWIDITSRVSEIVTEVPVREGQRVKAGDLLLKLLDDELSFAEREKRQAFAEAEERLRTAELDEADIKKNELLKKLQFEKASREFARFNEIFKTDNVGAVSEEEFENRKFAVDEAKLGQDIAAVASEKAVIATQLSRIAVEQAKLAWDRAKLDLERTEIMSPIDGAIAFLEIRPGEMVQSGTKVLTVVNRDQLFTEVRVPQRHLVALQVGQRVEIEAETYPDRVFEGQVQVIHPSVDPEQGTVKVRIGVSDPDKLLLHGIYVTAKVDLAVHDNALLVPKRARMFDGDQSVIFVVRDQKAVRLTIPVGLQNAEVLEVLPGAEDPLTDSDVVITRGHTRLQDGVDVRVFQAGVKPAAASDGAAPTVTPASSKAAG